MGINCCDTHLTTVFKKKKKEREKEMRMTINGPHLLLVHDQESILYGVCEIIVCPFCKKECESNDEILTGPLQLIQTGYLFYCLKDLPLESSNAC